MDSLTARELSYHEAQAGIAARDQAQTMGGDPAQVRALVHAAAASHVSPLTSHSPTLRGRTLRADDLLVTLCLTLHAQVFGVDPRVALSSGGAASMQALAALAFIFLAADEAYDLLDHAADASLPDDLRHEWSRDFKRAAIALAGDFTASDISLLTAHLTALSRHNTPQEDDTPGEPQPPPPAAP